jgi:hypothetical protein
LQNASVGSGLSSRLIVRKNWFIAYMPPVIFAVLGVLAYMDDDRPAAYAMWVLGAAMPLFMLLVLW